MNVDIPLGEEYNGLDVSVVGGFCRDILQDRESNDVDLVVTGVTAENMKNRGFRHIMSADDEQPVFIDSDGREVAIARQEESTGDSHRDFDMNIVDPQLDHREALNLDLERRDLTINAIAINLDNNSIYDPFDGRSDLEDGVIRHINEHFKDDPLRVLRAARYAVRFSFDIADETVDIMRETAPKMEHLVEQRFGNELIKVLAQSESPRRYFDILRDVNALQVAYPRIHQLTDVPAGPHEHHKEGSAYEHTMLVLEEMHSRVGNDVNALLAALFHDIGKINTDADVLPNHYGHAKEGSEMAEKIRQHFEFERKRRGVISTACQVHMKMHKLDELRLATVVDLADDIHNSPLDLETVVGLQISDSLGRQPQKELTDVESNKQMLQKAIEIINTVDGYYSMDKRGIDKSDINDEIAGGDMGDIIKQDRVEKLRSEL